MEQTRPDKYRLISKARPATVGDKDAPECRYEFSVDGRDCFRYKKTRVT